MSLNGEERDNDTAALLQDMVLDSADAHEFLDGLVRVAADRLSKASASDVFCAVTLLRPRQNVTVASSSDYARKMDEIQYNFDDGPCLRAARQGDLVHVRDFRTETRFPEYRAAVAEHGILSALGVPIPLEGDANAGLNVYCVDADAFDDAAVEAAEFFALEAARALRFAVRIAHFADQRDHLLEAMESRTTIDLAAGIIMDQNKCSQDEAISILKAASNARNLKLRDLATTMVQSIGNQPPRTHFD